LEAREYVSIEQRIADAEQSLQSKRAALEDPTIASDGPRLLAAHTEMEAAQRNLDTLYARWAELQEKAEGSASR
jgi:ATP-binding cassette subfamily F protein uup